MKTKIEITNQYGFAHYWTLVVPNGKRFYLGQDVKVCRRLLGCEPADVINEISKRTGLNRDDASDIMNNECVNKCLVDIIVEKSMGNLENLLVLESWELSVE